MNPKEMTSKASTSLKSLVRASGILSQVAYDMHFESDIVDVADTIRVNVEQLAEKIHELKLSYSSKS